MNVSTSVVSAVLIFFSSVAVVSAHGHSDAPPQKQLKTYPLRNSPNSADISPDEQLVVTEITKSNDTSESGTKTFAEIVQLWNFREDHLVAEFPAERVDAKKSSQGLFSNPVRGPRIVRFSSDGNLVMAVIDQTIYVLCATDLSEIRTIHLVAPDKDVPLVQGRISTPFDMPHLTTVEVSPGGETVAILWTGRVLWDYGIIELYDLTSGRKVLNWYVPDGRVNSQTGLTWHPNGKLLLIAVPVNCAPHADQPDIFAFDVQTGAIKYKFATGMNTMSLAITADNHILAVDGDCKRFLLNPQPKVGVFSLITGKHLHDVSLRGRGVRFVVSAAADGSRFLAFTGKLKTEIDWGDGLSYEVSIDQTFSVWNLKDYERIVTSQNIPGLNAGTLRLSSKGRYAVSSGKSSNVYELP